MAIEEQITLYANERSPFSQRVEIALLEANIPFTRCEVSLYADKPEWFTRLVNPHGKVPAITYGGPPAEPHQPAPESIKLSESLALVDFVADLAATYQSPEYSQLYAETPALRAKARSVVELYSQSTGHAFMPLFKPGGGQPDYAAAFAGITTLQEVLNESEGRYIIGDNVTTADVVIGVFVVRLEGLLQAIGDDKANEALEALRGEKFARFRKYAQDLKERKSFKKTFDEVAVREYMTLYLAKFRAMPAAC